MAAQYPDIYAAVGIHSGLACGAAPDLPSALAAMRAGGAPTRQARTDHRFVPVITFHGNRDATVSEQNSQQIVAAASAACCTPLEVRPEAGRGKAGRNYTKALHIDPEGSVLIEQWTIVDWVTPGRVDIRSVLIRTREDPTRRVR